MATLQSASFMARISFTPSPVMATVCPLFWSEWIKSCFCLGVTRPKTVYWPAASFNAESSDRRLASIY